MELHGDPPVPALLKDPTIRRRRAIVAGALVFVLIGLGSLQSMSHHDEAWRLVDIIKIGSLMALAVVLSLRSTTGFRITPRDPALEDELTQANRANAAQTGFWAMIAATVLAFVAGLNSDLTLAETAPLILGVGAISAAARFVILERRGADD